MLSFDDSKGGGWKQVFCVCPLQIETQVVEASTLFSSCQAGLTANSATIGKK